MKQALLFTAIFCSFLASCGNSESGSSDGGDSDEKESKKVSKRDFSITKENAYNDLFLDSMTMEKFIQENKVDEDLARRMRSFYNARNYQFAWFSSNGITEQAKGFWNLHDYHTTYKHDTTLHDKRLARRMDNLIAEENPSFSSNDKSTVSTELTLTEHFIQYMLNAYEEGFVKRKEMERFVPRKKEDVMYLADSLLTKKHKDGRYFEDVNERYKAVKDELGKYYNIAKAGGWPQVTATAKSLKPNAPSPAIAVLKKRLSITGDMPAGDTTQFFTDTLLAGIKNFQ